MFRRSAMNLTAATQNAQSSDSATPGPGRLSSPGEFHPEALADPYVNVSVHTAPIIQPEKEQPTSSERTDSDYVLQLVLVLASVSHAECTVPFSYIST